MNAGPVVTVLHDGVEPDAEFMRPVLEQATVRFADGASLADALPGAEALFVYDFRSTALPGAWDRADRMRWVHVGGTGVDAVMFDTLIDSDVQVTNTRGLFDEPIAEYVLAQVLAFAKDLPESLRLQQRHQWRHRESERVAGAAVLVVGTGSIGRAIARLLRAAGMRVRGLGRTARIGDPDFGTVATDLHAELPGADYVVCVTPLTPQTRHMFDASAFAAMKPHARFINVGRGESVVTDDLVAALRGGVLAGAALDVVDPEPLPAGHPLWDLPNVVVTPHNSGDFIGWRAEIVAAFTENFERWASGQPLHNVVDKKLGYVPS
ncbi:hydroxyacid dehydrogenase [Nocardia sp. 852002-20019_SCH5090214]|jgi:phosphoglycerate dehydrogenase-like enzyme|uniref:D-2-hydroxyacid dehydrogenase n=1 Tax=Nocardia nova TaxID=37330 RepID=A0A2S6A9L3_9NOCA|nr:MULTISPECIES: D-2-hydroxyacid dehydrogenase [Nocardia]OBF69458.1 hydroxyacid dehydrogenase [Mycobacterium sp. 852002-51759_SCH5129042]MBF6274385.1 D-2-hydroxyacid dehydrogenase [Nocardia nova]OBA54196.1 hydroxyacid dehydrogenase [Nocardia sp. 852002-51101_SCH5132738]OBA62849.1 hydroxyacid dehydrogenase [Nocardia sp. 852002-20019_SCH5090214]OBB44242.1 hydroxyacid dehydrogenase [Nocardia sp. 852002-51244_SCH5132740]